jgi:hypothetical protein
VTSIDLSELMTHAHEQETKLRARGEIAEAGQWEAIGWAAGRLIWFEQQRTVKEQQA